VLSDGLAAGLRVLRRDGTALASVTFILLAPFELIGALINQGLGWGEASAPELIIVSVIVTVGGTIASGAAIALVHARGSGETATSRALVHSLGRLPTLLLLTLVASVAIFSGLILLVVPGLVLITWWFSGYPVAVIEKRSAIDALGRSRKLTRGAFWPTFAVAVPSAALYIVVSYGAWRAGVAIADNAVGSALGGTIGDAAGIVVYTAFAVAWFEQLRHRETGGASDGLASP